MGSTTLSRTDAFRQFVQSDTFPCIGAKSAMVRDQLMIAEFGDIDSAAGDINLRRALEEFIEQLDFDSPVVQSFVAIFTGPTQMSETEFERALWNRLQSLHNLDVVEGRGWAESAERDPESAHFSMGLLGEAFFVIGLHPDASRPARRFEFPALVFNSHEQFERLREDGRFEKMKKIIRERDKALAGSVNPMLADFGRGSEAAQYSGREVGPDWKCPFGAAFILRKGERLTVTDPEGEQVSDMVAYNLEDRKEVISSGRSLDYAGRMFLTKGDILYSNRSNDMLKIVEDEVGRHDFTLTPCSKDTFRKLYNEADPKGGCQENLEAALADYDIGPDDIPIAFNIFMHVATDPETGEIKVLPPLSKAGQSITFEACMDLLIGMTSCSAGESNNFAYKPIDYEIASVAV